MFTYESGKRESDPWDHSQDLIAANAIKECTASDVETTIRVLEVMADHKLAERLAETISRDTSGNPILDTEQQKFAQNLWSSANEQSERIREVAEALKHAYANVERNNSENPDDTQADSPEAEPDQ